MATVGIHFSGSANFKPVQNQIAAINSQLAAMQQQLLQTSTGINAMNQGYRQFVNRAAAMEGLAVSSMRAQTETARLTEQIRRGDIRLREHGTVMKNLNEITEKQLSLRKSLAVTRTSDAMGNVTGSLITPTNSFADAAERAHMRASILNQTLQGMAGNVVNWGKNMQWAGRQLTVGLTMPMVALGAAAGMTAYKVDQELTRMIKVYGEAGKTTDEELMRVRQATIETSKVTAREYGMMAKDTAALGAAFAATGLQGQELQETIDATARVMSLGEVNEDEAIKATIAIQSIFKTTSEELKRTFDTMNAIENETSTSAQDLIEAVPRAASVIKQLGGSMNDLQVFTVAFKEGGIAAGEGANALRSGLARILRPTKITQQALDKVNISIDQLMAQNRNEQGQLNLMNFMQDLGNAFNALNPVDAQRTMTQVFGIHRYNALTTLLKNITDEGSQAADALRIVERSSEDLARGAEEELERWRQSASGKVKTAIATFNAEFAKIGEGFLPIAATLINFATWILEAFQKIPGPIAAVGKALISMMVVIGPMIMLIGLFGNLFGQVTKGVLMWKRMTQGLHSVTTGQERFSQLVSQSISPITQETIAVEKLTAEMKQLNIELQAVLGSQGRLNRSTMVGKGPADNPNGNVIRGSSDVRTRKSYWSINGKAASGEDPRIKDALNQAVPQQAKLADDAERAAAQHRMSASTLLGTVSTIGLLTAGGNEWVMKISVGLLILSAAIPLIQAMHGMYKRMAVESSIRAKWDMVSAKLAAKTAGGLGFAAARQNAAAAGAGKMRAGWAGIATAAKAASKSIFGLIGPLGVALAAVMAIYGAFKLIQRSINKAKEDQRAMGNAAKDAAEIVGFTWKESNESVKDYGIKIEDAVNKSKKLGESQKPVIENLKEMNRVQQDAFVNQLALQARIHGATKDQAIELAALYLDNIGRGGDATRVIDRGALETEMGALGELTQQWGTRMGRQFGNKYEQSAFEGFRRVFGGLQDLNDRAKEDASQLGKDISELIGKDIHINDRNFDIVRTQLRSQIAEIFSASDLDDRSREVLIAARIDPNDSEAVLNYLNDLNTSTDATSPQLRTLKTQFQQIAQAQKIWVDEIIKAKNLDPADFEGVDTLAELQTRLGSNLISTAEAWGNYNRRLLEAEEKTGRLTTAEALRIQNEERAKAGLPAVTRLLANFGDTAENAAGQVSTLDDATRAMFERRTGDFLGALKSQAGTEISDLIQIGLDAYDAQTKTAEKAYENQANAAEESFSRQADAATESANTQKEALDRTQQAEIDAVEKARDDRIQRIENEAAAEEKLDQTRQKMFERERTRLQRLAEDRNASIDFNMALREGNIDEAARLMNAGEARILDRNMQDAESMGEEASAARKEARKRHAAKIEEDARAELDALKVVHDESKKALDRRLDDERKALEQRKRNRLAEIQDEKAAYAERRRANRETLEKQLADEKLYAVRNIDEFKNSAKRIQGILAEQRVTVNDTNQAWADKMRTGWTDAVDRAQKEIQREESWKNWSAQIGDQVTQGLLGMTWEEFMTYMRTGVKPTPVEPKTTAQQHAATQQAKGTTAWRQGLVAHGGGEVSLSGDRGGRSMNAGLFNDEVPTILQTGEYVIKREAVANMGKDALDLINSGKQPYEFHHGGGLVGGVGALLREGISGALRELVDIGVRRKNEEAQMAGRADLMLMGGILPEVSAAFGEAAAPPGEDRFVPWMTPTQRNGVRPDVMERVWRGLGMVPGAQQITSGYRPGARVAGSGRVSLHSLGKAVDIGARARGTYGGGTAETEAMGDRIAHVFRTQIPGVREVLWKTLQGGNHYDHVHVGFRHGGGQVGMDIPGLKTGGRIRMDNTLANLHANETVLTAPLSARLERGINNMDNSSSAVYNININGAGINDAEALANVVVRKLQMANKNKGPSRVVR